MTKRIASILLIIAFMLELGMMTFLSGSFGLHISPLIFFTVSLLIGIGGIMLAFKNKENEANELQDTPFLKKVLLPTWLIAGIITTSISLMKIFSNFKIDVKYSDIIPQVSVLVKRFLNHEFPYQVISEWGYNLFPTYLPLQWLPFTIPEVLHFDYRWIAFAVLCSAIIFYGLYFLRKNISTPGLVILLSLPFISLLLIAKYDPSVFAVTIENLIAGYYLILCLTIFTRSNLLRGLGLVLCLLSRYSLIFWVPLYLTIIFFSESKKNALIIAVFCVMGVILIYGLPFLTKNPAIFLKGYNYHTYAAVSEWTGQSWQAPGDKPVALFKGFGFASYFYDYLNGGLIKKLRILQIVHFVGSIVVIVILGILFFKFKNNIDYKIYALGSLKIYLVFFYNFIQIPYSYLFIVPVFVSLPILGMAMLNLSIFLHCEDIAVEF